MSMLTINKLNFGTAGVPISTRKHDSTEGVKRVQELNLGCMELEFVRGVKMSLEKAKEVGKEAKKQNVILSCHAPYYINLNSMEKQKIVDSMRRILNSARVSAAAGGYSVTFHPAYYMKKDKRKVYDIVKKSVSEIVAILKQENINLWIRPETTGKESQFGDVDELIKLSQDVDNVMPCIDFSHVFARSIGKINSYAGFSNVLEKLEKGLGKTALNNMHCHISGIAYGPKGERNHVNLRDCDLKIKELLKALKDYDAKGIVICESPNIEEDAVYMKGIYESL